MASFISKHRGGHLEASQPIPDLKRQLLLCKQAWVDYIGTKFLQTINTNKGIPIFNFMTHGSHKPWRHLNTAATLEWYDFITTFHLYEYISHDIRKSLIRKISQETSTCEYQKCYTWVQNAHDDVIKWKHFPHYCIPHFPYHRSLVNSGTKASDAELWCFLWSTSE